MPNYPMLTDADLRKLGLCDEREHREMLLKIKYTPVNYDVADDGMVVVHRETSAVFHIDDDGALTIQLSGDVPDDEIEIAKAGARKAAQMDRKNHPSFAVHRIGANYTHV